MHKGSTFICYGREEEEMGRFGGSNFLIEIPRKFRFLLQNPSTFKMVKKKRYIKAKAVKCRKFHCA